MITSSACCTPRRMSYGHGRRVRSCGEAESGFRYTPTTTASRRSRVRGRRGRSRRTIRASRRLPRRRASWWRCGSAGSIRRARRSAGAEAAHADQPLQCAPDVAGPGAPAAGRGGAGGLRVASGLGRRGAVGAAAGAELGAGRVGEGGGGPHPLTGQSRTDSARCGAAVAHHPAPSPPCGEGSRADLTPGPFPTREGESRR